MAVRMWRSRTPGRLEEARGEFLGRQRRAAEEALDLLAAGASEELLLFGVLHPFGDHRQLQAVGEGDDGAGDGGVVVVVGQAGDERLVDLQDVDGQALEVAERGVAGAEVVDRQLQAELLERLEDRQGFLLAVHHEGFGDFQLQALRAQCGAAQQLADPSDQLRLAQLGAGQVDRQRTERR